MSNISPILWKFKPTQDVKQLCVMEALPPFVDSLLYSRLYLLTHVLCYVQTYTHVCICFSNLLEPFPNILKILWYFSLGNLLENSQQKFTHFTVALLYLRFKYLIMLKYLNIILGPIFNIFSHPHPRLPISFVYILPPDSGTIIGHVHYYGPFVSFCFWDSVYHTWLFMTF